jgi:tetratricopeptide (TPR) repeat protein
VDKDCPILYGKTMPDPVNQSQNIETDPPANQDSIKRGPGCFRWELGCLALLGLMLSSGPQVVLAGTRQLGIDSNRAELSRQILEVAELVWPGSAGIHDALGQSYVKEDDMSAATRQFSQAVELDPELAAAQNNLGVVLLQSNQAFQAIPHLKAAQDLDPGSAQVMLNLGRAQLAAGESAAALETAQRAAELEPQRTEAWLLAGQAALARKDHNQAQTFFEKALQLDAGYAPALMGMGVLLLEDWRTAESLNYLTAASQLQPQDPYPHLYLGIAYERLADPERSQIEFNQAAALNQDPTLNEIIQTHLSELDQFLPTVTPAEGGAPTQTP